MENSQKAIMIGVGLFITIIIIGAVMAIMGVGTGMLTQGQAQLGKLSANMQNQLTSSYDNTNMTGAQVLAAINTLNAETQISVQLYNGTSTTAPTAYVNGIALYSGTTLTAPSISSTHSGVTTIAVATIPGATTKESISSYTTTGNTNYISATARYKSVLIKNGGDVVGVAFIQI